MSRFGDRLERATLHALMRTPARLADKLFGRPPVNDRGVALDPQLHILLQLLERSGRPTLDQMPPEQARRVYRKTTRAFDVPFEPAVRISCLRADGPAGPIPLRIYDSGGDGDRPALVFFHGGGFVVGDAVAYDGVCSLLAERARCVVISADYRRAPEHRFPAAVEDASAAYRWVVREAHALGVDPKRIAVGGDSAGGNLATALCQIEIDEGGHVPFAQWLVYPPVGRPGEHPSREALRDGFFLTGELVEYFIECYLGADDPSEDPRLVPLLYPRLDRLPPCYILTAGFDPLRDEGEEYADRLREAGVVVMHRSADRLLHGFFTMGSLVDAARREVEDVAEELRRAFHVPGFLPDRSRARSPQVRAGGLSRI